MSLFHQTSDVKSKWLTSTGPHAGDGLDTAALDIYLWSTRGH